MGKCVSAIFCCLLLQKKKGQGKILHFMPFKFWQTLRQGYLREISDLFSEKNIIKYVKIHKRVGFIICPLLILKERMVWLLIFRNKLKEYDISMGYSKYRSTIGCTPPPPCIGVYLLPALPTGILLPLHRHDGSHLPCMVWSPLSQQSLTADMETTHVFC